MRTKLALAFSAFFLSLGGAAHATVADTGSNAAPAPVLASQSTFDPSLAASGTSGPTPSIVPGLNQLGEGVQTGLPYPSDQSGAIGPDYYIQGVNNMGVAVFRRSDLSMVAGPVSLGTFSNAPNDPEVVDSQFMWDTQTQRFYYSFTYKKWTNNVRTGGILYGWTKTSDPTDLAGGWCQMRIDTGNDFDDRPKLGDNVTHLILATNSDPWSGSDYDRVWTIPKPANESTSCPANPQSGVKVFGTVSNPLKTSDGDIVDSAIAAQDNDGSANGWIVAADDRTTTANQIMLWHVNSSGDLVADGNIPVNGYSAPPGIPQPSPNQPLDPVDQRLNSAIADTDPDVGATAVWASHTIADPSGSGRSVVRWYELVPSACAPVTAGVCSSAVRRQQGEVSDPSNYLFNAAMAPTDTGNEAVLHYDSASASQLVQVRARSRVSNTPLGTLGPETVVETSDAAYDEPTCHDSRPYCRWGDYAAATTDPADPHAVWGTNQAIAPPNGGKMHWKSRNFAIQPTASPALLHSATGATGGDGDGVVEPGESVDLNETVRDAGGAGASNIAGTLSSGTTGLSITNASSPYPNVAAGGTATNSTAFGASVASTVGCGTPLSMGVTLNTAQGRYRVPLTVATGTPGTAQSSTSTDVPKAIPDANPTGASSTINVTSTGRVSDLNVTLSRIDHTFLGDIRIFLIGPDGTSVMLADRPGGYANGDNNMLNTVFDDDATAPISAGVAPYTGTFKPARPLSAFNGKPLQGTWTLKVVDVASGDTGSIVGWGMRATPALCDVSSTNTPPAAGFSVSPQPAVTGQAVTFTSTSSDPDGSVASQAWDLDNDGQFDDGTGTSATRSFTPSGTYTVRLRVTDNSGASSIVSKTVTIDNRPPVASFTAAPDPSVSGQTVTFTSTSTDPDGTVTAHAWDLDNDGQFNDGTGAAATKAFAKAGSYTVRLRETDDTGATSIASRTVTVDNRAPSASFSVSPAAPVSGSAVTFTSTSSDPDGTIASQAWDLDNDGQFNDGTAATASKTFATPGTYTVRLQVTDDNGAVATTSQTVTVGNRPPVASFGSSPATPSTGDSVAFTSTSTDPDGFIASQAWDLDNDGAFDDGTGVNASKTFATTGTYTVRLQVTDDRGATSVVTHTISVGNRAPVASFTASPAAPVSGAPVTFTSTATDPDGTIASQAWDLDNDGQFNDGTGASASKTFSKAGTYTVRLQVTDNNGGTNTTSQTVTVANRPPVASFGFSPAAPTTADAVAFTSNSTDPDGFIASQAWDLDNDGQFNDGTGANASKTFAKAGTYTVRLQVTDDNGATNTVSKSVTVANSPPVAAFSIAPASPQTGQAVTFTSSSSDPDGTIASQAWDLDNDGVYDNGSASSATKTFAKAGTYTVGLKVTDDNGATNTVAKTVTVSNRAPSAAFSFAPTSPTTGQAVTFTSSSSDPDGTIASQAWDLDNDGAYNDGTAATASKTFAKAGTYTVGLKVTDDNGASTTISKNVTVANRPPVAAFSSAPAAPLTRDPVTFTSTSSDPDGTIASQAWDLDNDGAFDDGTGTTATKSFSKAGTYTVRLQVTDDNGASATVSHTVTIGNRKPVASFTTSPNPTSTDQTVSFDSTSADPDGTIASQSWDLNGDGTFDSGRTDPTESVQYPQPGTYTITLKVTDDSGATDTKTDTVTIDNRAPTAKFSFSPSGPATGQPVTFTSESSDPENALATQAWDLDDDGAFDDGTATTASQTFAKGGPHVVHLRVTDAQGLSSTATQTVTVGGRPPTASFTVDPQTVVTGEPSHFDAAGSTDPDGTVVKYLWDLDGDGSFETDTGTSPVTSRFYADPGNVIVGLKVIDDDGQESAVAQRTVTVNEAPPFADGPAVPPPDSGPLPGVDPTPDPGPQPAPGKAPRGSVRVLTHSLAETLRRGLPLRFSSNEAATAKFVVLTGKRRLAAKTKLVGAGRASVRLKLSSAPHGPLTVKMKLIDAGGLSRTYSTSVTLR
jgi:PKD repeat protein